MAECFIKSISPSIYLKKGAKALEQMIRIVVSSPANFNGAEVTAEYGNVCIGRQKYDLLEGENTLEFFIEESRETRNILFKLNYGESRSANCEIAVAPPKHWVVHVVQLSHHDIGYTDLASNVIKEQARNLTEAIAHAEQTELYPDDAKFRLVIEQTWSLDGFFRNASEKDIDKMIGLLQNGRFELTALYGNMTSEICGHESLIRTAYQSAKLSRNYGIPVISAEHNDVPGISWGLSEVLANSGVKLICPGLPLYYGWGNMRFRSFWNAEEIFGYNAPGAFWWETPTGKQVLFWCNNQGCGGGSHGALPQLERDLERIDENGYPYSVIRFPVGGGYRDNSPYIKGYADTILKWNEKWAYPRLICSTNAKFYEDFIKAVPDNLPVWRGELPGQDYPSGATSTAIPLSVNRRNHNALISAEKLASAASLHTDYVYQNNRIDEAYEETILFDEHTWGYHFPAGPTARASEYEKALRAFRAEAFAAEVRDKSMAHIADKLKLKSGETYLVVFNQTSWTLTAPLAVNMREMDGTGSVMCPIPPEKEVLRGVILDYRWHTYPDNSCINGNFDLIDETTGENVLYDLTELNDVFEPVDFSPQRMGLGQGTKRYGGFEDPVILRYNLCFTAKNVPAHGYKAYRLRLKNELAEKPDMTKNTKNIHAIENDYYRIAADLKTMRITSIYDKEAERELIDPNGGDFYRFIIRNKNSSEENFDERCNLTIERKNTYEEIRIEASVIGHPVIRHNIRLCSGIKNIYFETSVFKDPTPLLNAHLAFPLKADNPNIRYESALSVIEPVKDYFPNGYSDLIAVQNWVRIQDGGYYMLWNSIDAPMAGFCKLWSGYVSPAHRCFVDESFRHDPQTESDYQKNGWIFSQLFNNNFGTNFSVSQTGLTVFRYCLTSGSGIISDSEAARWGWQVSSPQATIFTDRASQDGIFESCGKFLECDNPEVSVLNWKAAEDGRGYIVRLWNMSDDTQDTALAFAGFTVTAANLTDMVEVDLLDTSITIKQNMCVLKIKAREIVNVRVYLNRKG